VRLYPRLLEDQEQRRLAEEFWHELLSRAAGAYGWTSPWFATLPDDAANIYSAVRSADARGFTLDHMPDESPTLYAWCDTFDEDGDAIEFLRISTDGSVTHLSTICGWFERWIGTNISPDDMDRLVETIQTRGRSTLLGP
jgi:hypothetical protein